MKEVQIRAAIYSLTLKPNTKLTLLGVLSVVDWKTFSGPCSSRDVGKRMSMKETSVRRSFKELNEMGLIRRSASRRAADQHHRAVTYLEVQAILDLAHNELPPLAHSELPLAHNELPPLAHNELPLAHSELPHLAHSELQYNLDNNLDNNPSSTPLSTEESNGEVNGEFDRMINELAEMTHCSLDEARGRVEHYASVRQISQLDALRAIQNMTAKMRRAR
jgi:DNA-binding MarR family transcriptional regulator